MTHTRGLVPNLAKLSKCHSHVLKKDEKTALLVTFIARVNSDLDSYVQHRTNNPSKGKNTPPPSG